MAYDEGLAERIRYVVNDCPGLAEKKRFGGLAFMVRGNMCCGILGEELMLRVGPYGYDEALSMTYTRKMDFTGRAMKGMIYVTPEGFESDEGLKAWIDRALAFVNTLPEK